jgi:hypothetical protein
MCHAVDQRMTRSTETPPTLRFELDWANGEERTQIIEDMRRFGRQTMNLRTMPDSKLLRLRAIEDNNRIVGWAGVDTRYTPGIAETFSLFVVPEYRAFLVGLILETARCSYIANECPDVTRVLTRMESSTNSSLLRYRLNARLMVPATREDVGLDTVDLCQQCELYGKSCPQQAFLWLDVRRFLARGHERLGFELSTRSLPTVVTIDPSRIRRGSRDTATPSERPWPRASSRAPAMVVE